MLNEKDVKFIKNEVMILKKFDHPNIVRLIADYEDKKYYHTVIELIQGGSVS